MIQGLFGQTVSELREAGDRLGAVEHPRLGDVSPLTFDIELLGCDSDPVVVEDEGGSGALPSTTSASAARSSC
jgi:hypothetical protein